MTDETADIREELTAYSLPSVDRRASMMIDGTRIQPGDVLESSGRTQNDYKLVVDCTEEDIICYVPDTDSYVSYPWDLMSMDLGELFIHHPQVIP